MWELVFSNYLLFLMVLTRMMGMVLFNPVFARRQVPTQIKIGLAFFITVIVTNVIPYKVLRFAGIADFMFAALKELLIGFAVGFIFQMFMSVILTAGEMIDLQIGVGMSKVYDPQSNVSMPVSGSIFNLLFILIFFSSNGHLTFVRIMALSFEVVPAGTQLFNPDFSRYIVELFGSILVLAVQLAFPVIAIELITEAGLGVLMRAVPQINVFVAGLQLKILIGLVVIILMLPGAAGLFDNIINSMFESINRALNLI